jgi:hypothetical protein
MSQINPEVALALVGVGGVVGAWILSEIILWARARKPQQVD